MIRVVHALKSEILNIPSCQPSCQWLMCRHCLLKGIARYLINVRRSDWIDFILEARDHLFDMHRIDYDGAETNKKARL